MAAVRDDRVPGRRTEAPAGGYRNVLADPEVTVQDGPRVIDTRVRELQGAEREEWWRRAVAAYPPYAEYHGGPDRAPDPGH